LPGCPAYFRQSARPNDDQGDDEDQHQFSSAYVQEILLFELPSKLLPDVL